MPLVPVKKVNENSSCEVEFILKDEDGVVVAGSSLSTATYTLKNQYNESVINSRTNVDFSANVTESGVAIISLVAADSPIVSKSAAIDEEIHVLTVTFAWPVSKALVEEIWIKVINLKLT